ncbi:MAG: hypothetical protein A4E45_00983 [Methanosaeta sp. PtaB.Bin039]|nr:MAG: hypothetical protein A4E45_00983 [Methanosaeta sp. PtaB.Bin039]HOT98933.1 hypothetical protein [bacterium]HQF17746.1 hypothetical protein [Methanotrichaceae archaeon]
MEDLFRFFLVRPATKVGPDAMLHMEQPTDFIAQLRDARSNVNANRVMRDLAQRFVSNGYADSVDKLRLGAKLQSLGKKLADVPADQLNASTVKQAVVDAFGAAVAKVVVLDDFVKDRGAAWDAIIAIKLVRSEHGRPLVTIVHAIRLMGLIERLAEDPASLNRPGAVKALLERPIALPAEVFPLPPTPVDKPAGPPPDTSREEVLKATHKEARQIRAALDELAFLEPRALNEDSLQGPDPVPVPMAAVARRGSSGAFTPPAAPHKLFTLKPEVAQKLSAGTTAAIKNIGLTPTETRIDRLAHKLETRLGHMLETIAELEMPERRKNVVSVGGTLIQQPPVTIFPAPQAMPAPDTSQLAVPDTHGNIQPVGVADLLIVKQELKRYQVRELAHIENVLMGERKEREHKRATTTEEIIVSETERTTEEERELESTERFEMKHESEETIREDARLEAGLKISGKYGLAVEFETYANGSISDSRQRSTRHASEYASEVTNRASSKITERFRQQVTRRILRQVEETNRHLLDNVNGPEHISGLYQWVEKVYEAQVFNYGLRTLYDITVPEPASLLIAALKKNITEGEGLEKPADLTITPNQLTEFNYNYFVREYEVTGVEPPPERYVTVAKTFKAGPDTDDSETRGVHVDSADLTIPDGYEALWGHATLAGMNYWDNINEWSIDLSIGRRRVRFNTGLSWAWGTTLDSETAAIPVAIETWRVMNFALGLEVTCQRTARAVEKWQQATYAAILQAYQQKRSDYEEKLNALRTRAGIVIEGRSPDANRQIERSELKRACITLLTRQHFDLFDSIETGATGLPQLDLTQAEMEGTYIRFFEQAFEWENMTYVFYPYFWGRKEDWLERLRYENVDPTFEAFLKAGAARVVVPARPGFEPAIDHFMSTGMVWTGGELPPVTSPDYVPILTEIQEQLGAPGVEVPQGEPWEVVLPTTLVYLRASRELPRWTKNAAGEWEPTEDSG